MNNAKEKATEIFWLTYGQINGDTDDNLCIASARACAKISVNEILKSNPLEPTYTDWDDCGATHKYWYEQRIADAKIFWNEVLLELDVL